MKGAKSRPARVSWRRGPTRFSPSPRLLCSICEYIGWLGPDVAPAFAEAVAETASRMPDGGIGPVGDNRDKVDVTDGDLFMFPVRDIRRHVRDHPDWTQS